MSIQIKVHTNDPKTEQVELSVPLYLVPHLLEFVRDSTEFVFISERSSQVIGRSLVTVQAPSGLHFIKFGFDWAKVEREVSGSRDTQVWARKAHE